MRFPRPAKCVCGNLCTFAVVIAKKRKIAAYVLLAVFLPILLLSSLHVHEATEYAEVSCVDCLHNHCGGHLTQTTFHMDDCVLCQFLTLPMLTAAMMAVTLYIHVYKKYYAQPLCGYHAACCGVNVTRGPPSF